jgi:small-conductance mechanosensitive channel
MTTARTLAAKLGPPFILTAGLAGLLYLGGEAYQVVGLQALKSTETVLGKAFSAVAIFSAAVLLQRLMRYVVLEGLVGGALGGPVPRLLPQLTGLVIYVVAGGAVAGFVFNQDLTALWAASGVLGVVFGMALREMILDVFSGLAINLDRPIRIGDRIQVVRAGMPPLIGRVLEISWRSTRLYTEDDNLAVVPNSLIAGSTIVNMSLPEPQLEFLLPITLDAGVDPERAMRILLAAATEASAGFAKPGAPPAYVRLRAVTTTGAEYGVYIFPATEIRYRARSQTLAAVLRHLTAAGIEPAWPKLERRDEPTPGTEAVDEAGVERVVGLLAAHKLFVDIDKAALQRLASGGRRTRLTPGTVAAQAGEVATVFFVVLEGLLQEQPGGALRGPGAVVGAEAMLGAGGYERTLTASTEAEAVVFDFTSVAALLDGDDRLAGRLAGRLAADVGSDDEARADYAADVLGALRRTYALR